MLLLTSTSDLITLVTTAANATHVQASWVDINDLGVVTPGRTNTIVSSATTTTLVTSPDPNVQRNIKGLIIRAVGGAQTITLNHTDGTTVVQLFKVELAVGEVVAFNDGAGFQVFTSAGQLKEIMAYTSMMLNDLSDVLVLTPGLNDYLRWNGTEWVNTPALALDNLSDVTLTTPDVDQILKFNGSEWVNSAASSSSASNGVDFFPDDASIIGVTADNAFPLRTLSKTPIIGTEDVDSIVVSSTTAMYGAYLYDTALGSTSIEAGVWNFDFYCGVSSSNGVTSLSANVMRVRPAAGTVTITTEVGDTTTSRTATASTGTPFDAAKIDASASLAAASFLRTPAGWFQITSRISNTVVRVATLASYTNESTVAFSVYKKLFAVTTGEINTVASTYAAMGLITVNSVQPAFTIEATDKLAQLYYGTSDSSPRTVYFSHNGTSKYTHFHTPLTTRHNDLAGLQGGTSGERYHMSALEHAAATAAQSQLIASIREIGTATPQALGVATPGTSLKSAAEDHVHVMPKPTELAADNLLRTLWIPVDSIRARTTSGAAPSVTELATNRQMLDTLNFDAATNEFAQFTVAMPKSWNEGTVTAAFVWTAASGSGTVCWTIQATAYGNGDEIDVSWGTAQLSTDTLIGANYLHVSEVTGPITIGGTPVEGDVVWFQVYRDTGVDSLAVDAQLLGVKLFLTINSLTDA